MALISNAGSDTSNYLAVLTLAWTYVLSAYWSEVQKGQLCYTHSKAQHCPSVTPSDTIYLGKVFLFLDASESSIAEVGWWRAILAPGKGWEASINRHNRLWSSPWCLENDSDDRFIVVSENSLGSDNKPPTYNQSRDMLYQFAARHGLLRQSSMALMAALIIPTHHVWGIPVRLPAPIHLMNQCSQNSKADITAFQRLIDLLPRLVTISSFGVEGVLRSAFYDESIHSLSSGQWIQPAMISWPHSSVFAAEVGCQRCPQLAKWWIGMAISGMLSAKSVRMLVGTGMWPTNLVLSLWTGAKDSYFCTVFEQDICITVTGNGPWTTIPRATELLMLFMTSGEGPEGRLMEATSCPWKPPGDVQFEKSSTKVLLTGRAGAKCSLFYNEWNWGEGVTELTAVTPVFVSYSIDEMAEKSGTATRAVLGWLESARGPDADLNVELQALQRQIQMVEDDSQVDGSGYLSDCISNTGDTLLPTIFRSPSAFLGVFGKRQFDDAELMESWNVKMPNILKCADCNTESADSYGWCGLDAINFGLTEVGLTSITKDEVLETLSRMEDDIRREGICVNELEYLLNTRERSVAVVDRQSGRRLRLAKAKYSHSIINVAVDFAPHFIAISQRLAE